MDSVAQALISGVVLGSVYALMTVGLTLIYGTLRTLNMAHGVVVMAGGYIGWLALEELGLGPGVGMVLAFLGAFLFGIALHHVAVRPLIGRKGVDLEMAAFISTLAVAIIVQNLALLVFGGRNKPYPPLFAGDVTLLGGVTVTWHSVAMCVIALALLGALGWFLARTRHGLAIGAVAMQLDAARLMGIAVGRTYTLTMALASGLAAIAGVLLASIYYVSPVSGDLPLLKALIVAILGGLGSVRGTVVAAFGIGVVESGIALSLGAKWSLPVLFLAIMVLLTVRPYGLYGRPQEARL